MEAKEGSREVKEGANEVKERAREVEEGARETEEGGGSILTGSETVNFGRLQNAAPEICGCVFFTACYFII